MSDQPSVASVDTAVVPSPGYYPDPSVPGFVRYWNGGAWVPGTSRAAPAAGEVLEVPRFAVRPNPRPNARYIPPPVAVPPVQPTETGPVFLDQTSAGAVFTMAPELADGSAWRADPQTQRGLMETGTAPRWVSWGVTEAAASEAVELAVPEAAEASVASVPEVVEAVAPVVEAPVEAPVVAALPALVPVPSASVVVRQKSAESTSPHSAHRKRPAVPARPAPLRPAALGRRVAARLLDGLILVAVAAATALPFVADTEAHVQVRLAQARTASLLTGREVQVWLVDGVVLGRLALLLGVLLVAGLLVEVLPTARTGRTLGKRLLGLRVVRTDGRRPPTLARSLARWLVGQLCVLTVLSLFAVLFDRQGRRGWHDRAAGTRVVES
ncbi:RDD family protein [Kitasatospora mediocidica]|uniref:RDD family protein n=1 Tax=Kitasatospora mediocidica TaxID=58352 RepID=UPI0005600F51|nr:RDD family protein [Kitasatospora mediocidica]